MSDRTMKLTYVAGAIALCGVFTWPASAQRDRGMRRGGPEMMLRMMPALAALDQDEDGTLSTSEIAAATAQLRTLDADGDGNLSAKELRPTDGGRGGRRGRGGFGGPGGPGGGMGSMMNQFPLMRALDLDRDGALFEDEVTDAAAHLRTLDRDGDGALGTDELMPAMGGFGGRGGRGGPGGGFGRGDRRGGGGDGGAVPAPEELDPEDGVATIPDRTTFSMLSYQGDEVMVDTHLAGQEFVKFQIEDANSDAPRLYFMNTKTHRSHPGFMSAMNMAQGRGGFGRQEGRMRGVLVYRPRLRAPNGDAGLYTFEFEPNDAYDFALILKAMTLLETKSELLDGRLSYNLLPLAKQKYLEQQGLYDEAQLPVFDPDEHDADVVYAPLHTAVGYGRLRVLAPGERPDERDIVLLETLPNELSRVAGVISVARQTPLSHVNLRAVQDDVPNAYVANALTDRTIRELLGEWVRYEVTVDGYTVRRASADDVAAHFEALRPAQVQEPLLDLTVREIRPFRAIGFDDAASVGVKAANLAELRRVGLAPEMTPDGFAVPFYYYAAFMAYNKYDVMALEMLGSEAFRSDPDAREEMLRGLRSAIKKGKMPQVMMDALTEVQAQFGDGASIRCRSSTNNEDLPGFSGAGLYDSFTHHPNEGHLSKSIKQVFASLWNDRAVAEREFYRIDHRKTAMGVVLHLNSEDERANGVAVTADVVSAQPEREPVRYYINAQVGEELVTNPTGGAIPEAWLIGPRNPATDELQRRTSRLGGDAVILDDTRRAELRRTLRAIHQAFAVRYGATGDEPFAMEVEFKVTSEGALFVKQARPWVF